VSRSITVVCEAEADFRAAKVLSDRVIVEDPRVHWIYDDETLDFHRHYRGCAADETFLLWRDVRSRALEAGIVLLGFLGGLPPYPDAHSALRALLLLRREQSPPDAILLVRDSDADPERRLGLEQARDSLSDVEQVVIGVAHPKRECWALAAFESQSDSERRALADLQDGNNLGFDPRLRSHELTAKQDHAKLSAKRVIRHLTGDDPVRETEALQTASLATLRDRGRENGLADFLSEVSSRLLRLFDPRPSDN
jgi:hypothetical protein